MIPSFVPGPKCVSCGEGLAPNDWTSWVCHGVDCAAAGQVVRAEDVGVFPAFESAPSVQSGPSMGASIARCTCYICRPEPSRG